MKLRMVLVATMVASVGACSADSDRSGRIDGRDMDPIGDGTTAGGNASGGDPGSGGSGAGNAGTNGTGGGGGAANDVCEAYAVRNDQVTPDMLIVLDKSGSMGGAGAIDCRNPDPISALFCAQLGVDCNDPVWSTFCGGGDRWGPSVDAVKGITRSLEDSIRFGLMAFPADNQCGPGNLLVEPEIQMADEIASELDRLGPNGATPTSATLEAALRIYEEASATPDALPHPPYVLLVTDGDPNCVDNQGQSGDVAAQEASYAAIDALTAAGIKTYVIGYDTRDSDFAQVLDEMARRGGTGDTAHRPVEDQASLEAEFQAIAGSAISCTFVLEQAPPDPSYVLVEIDGEQINLDDPNGWTLSEDGLTVQVQGDACVTLSDGREHVLSVEVLCEVVRPD